MLLVVLLLSHSLYAFTNSFQNQKDSIPIWIKASKNKNYRVTQQKQFLQKAYNELIPDPNPTDLSAIAFRYYQLKDTLQFKSINKKALTLALKLKDSFNIADTHWNYATYYLNGEIYDKSYQHFVVAYKYFDGIHKEYEAARMLNSMSFIKARYRDYSGSEVLIFEAIKKFKKLKNYLFLYKCYNRLGLLQNDIREYDRALFYHHKALEYVKKLKDQRLHKQSSANNIGLTYLEKGDYKTAIQYFDKVLSDSLSKNRYARAIDNKAFCKLMLGDTSYVKKDLFRALYIRDSIKNKAGVVSSKIRISEYYKYIGDTIKAIAYAKGANELAYEVKNGGDFLTSLNQLAKLDTKNSKKHLRRYIQFNDSLIAVERKVQNKFTRIDFETDEYIEETKRLSEQKVWIIVTAIGVALILSLVYFLRIQKSKTEKLLLETEQQKANEQVYLLTLQQQSLLEEEKAQERNRISEELHDGILSRLFGTRVGLGFLNLTGDDATQQQRQSFLEELQDIEKEIREVSHKLNTDFSSADINFTSIINQLLKDKSAIGNFQFDMVIDDAISWKKINEIIKVNIYRIVQESLQNIIKHANATLVTVTFSSKNGNLILHIKDNGNGFKHRKRGHGIGIKNMAARVQKMKGKFDVHSEVGTGTDIHITIPMI